jgi:hypothetical protein
MLKRTKDVLRGLLDCVLSQFAPPLFVLRANRRVQEPPHERTEHWSKLSRETLLRVISEEWTRAKSLEDKLTKTTTALSIAGAVSGAASRPLLDGLVASPVKTLVFICLFLSIISLFSGIIMGFAGMCPRPRGGIGPDFAVATQTQGHITKVACVDALASFEVSNIRLANQAAGANTAIRNGILLFVLATLVAMFSPRTEEKPPPHSSSETEPCVTASPAASDAIAPALHLKRGTSNSTPAVRQASQ